jgi:DNA-binding transcriptional MerR regulator
VSRERPPADYSIAAVSKLTGVSCHTLRVWERRYSFPTPIRTPAGQRRYRADEVEALRQIASSAKEGHSIKGVIAEFKEGRLSPQAEAGSTDIEEHPLWTATLDAQFVEHCKSCDARRIETILDDWEARLDPTSFASRIIEPTLIEIGELWFRREIRVYQEHLVSSLLFRRLDLLIERAKQENQAPRGKALVCAIQGDRHEGGVRLLTLALELGGWRAESLGVDLPVAELAAAVENGKPDAVGVSFVLSRNINKRFAELSKIRDVPIFVGGRSITNYQGLARRQQLIPLIAPVFGIRPLWEAECRRWSVRQGRHEVAVGH